jgi:CheY-like chemotaxis protein
MKVLVAVRNRATQKLLEDYMGHWQVESKMFSDIETATDAMLNQLGSEIILVDLRLVHGDPMVFSKRFRDLCESRHVRFGLLAEPDIALMLQNHLGTKGVAISKPIKRDELIAALSGDLSSLAATVQEGSSVKLSAQIPLNILVAEDNPINQDVAMGMLSSLGYEARIANNGQEALEIAVAGGIDLIFMDVQMPVMDGLEASRRIVAQMNKAERPLIVAMTANAMESDRQNCLAAGMDTFISKPFMMAELEQLIRQLPAFRTGGDWVQSSNLPQVELPAMEEVMPEEVQEEKLTNLAMLREVSGGDAGFIRGILQKMQVKIPEALQELKTALAEEDWETIRATSHRSKSSSAYTGAEGLKNQFTELEHMARDRQNLEEIPARLEILERTVNKVLKEIGEHLANL